MSLYDNITVIRESIEDVRDNYTTHEFQVFRSSLIEMLKVNDILDDDSVDLGWEPSDEWYNSGC